MSEAIPIVPPNGPKPLKKWATLGPEFDERVQQASEQFGLAPWKARVFVINQDVQGEERVQDAIALRLGVGKSLVSMALYSSDVRVAIRDTCRNEVYAGALGMTQAGVAAAQGGRGVDTVLNKAFLSTADVITPDAIDLRVQAVVAVVGKQEQSVLEALGIEADAETGEIKEGGDEP